MYHLKLVKGASYTGIVSATAKDPDVFTDSKAKADAAVASGFFVLVDGEKPKAEPKVEPKTVEEPKTEAPAVAPKSKRTRK